MVACGRGEFDGQLAIYRRPPTIRPSIHDERRRVDIEWFPTGIAEVGDGDDREFAPIPAVFTILVNTSTETRSLRDRLRTEDERPRFPAGQALPNIHAPATRVRHEIVLPRIAAKVNIERQ